MTYAAVCAVDSLALMKRSTSHDVRKGRTRVEHIGRESNLYEITRRGATHR